MATQTHMKYGDKNAMVQQAVGLFVTHSKRTSIFGRMTGKMPTINDAENVLKNQTSMEMPIVRCQDLGKGRGDEVTFNLLQPANAIPIMGSEYAEGRGTGLSITQAKLRVNQARIPIDMGDTMTQVRSPVDFRRLGRPVAQQQMDRYIDQTILVHMAGDRGYHINKEWNLPLASDPKFKELLVNPVKPPTRNRHYIADADGVKEFTVNAGEVDITTADVLKMDTIDSMKSVLEQIELPPPIVNIEGDSQSEDSPLRLWLVSSAQYEAVASDPNFRQIQASALARSSQAKNHPLFMGEVGIWNGFLIRKLPKPIRFYAGDSINYSSEYFSEVVMQAKVPDSFGENFAIDRSIILGGQAVIEAFARSDKSGIPFFWSEKLLDHDDKMEILIGTIRGVSKTRFDIDLGDGDIQYTDHGIVVVDAVVKTIGKGK